MKLKFASISVNNEIKSTFVVRLHVTKFFGLFKQTTLFKVRDIELYGDHYIRYLHYPDLKSAQFVVRFINIHLRNKKIPKVFDWKEIAFKEMKLKEILFKRA